MALDYSKDTEICTLHRMMGRGIRGHGSYGSGYIATLVIEVATGTAIEVEENNRKKRGRVEDGEKQPDSRKNRVMNHCDYMMEIRTLMII